MSHEYVSHSAVCSCVPCSVCGGTGYMPAMSQISDTMVEDFTYPTPCDACSGGIVEECEACRESEMEAYIDQPVEEYEAA